MTGTPSSFSLHERQIQDYLKGQEVLSRLITGGIAGIVGKSAIAPLERIKMIFQVTSQTYSWSSAYQKMKDIIKEGGLKSLWKGHSTTVLRVGPFAGLSYMIHDHTEEFFRSVYGSEKLPFFLKFMAGSIGGIGATVLTYPLDVLRVRLALIPESTWGTVLSRGGYFQGMSATVLGIIPYSGTGWMVKQTLMELYPHLHVRDGKPDVLGLLFINGIAGLVGQFVVYPLDIVRRRMQMQGYHKDLQKNQTLREVLKSLFQSEGRRGLTKGFSMNIVKGPITVSLSFTTYDLLRKWINHDIHVF